MPRILVVEDEPDLRQVLSYNLGAAGYDVVLAEDANAALAAVGHELPDLVLLDVMLPDLSGLDVCRRLKADPRSAAVPVMMLTARGEEIDRVVGFELGADDYVVKPFSVRELLLRIRAMLRRGGAPSEPATADDAAGVQFGRLRVDFAAHRVWVDGDEIALTALEFKLLCTLFERRNRVQSRAVLLDDVWGASPDNVTRTVDTHVKRLREKLGAAGAYVETVRGVGYRFIGAPPDEALASKRESTAAEDDEAPGADEGSDGAGDPG
jgi:two-component system phosphate regulon response regulator PhoB